ncbi:response regulator [Paenibacillus sp. CAU 1782]
MDGKWKVVIADDEVIIREGIRSVIQWEELNLAPAGEAEDGEEALELALAQAADIVLVDLSMPIMNGLTLIRHIREELPACKMIIITGHDEFAYAQEAIKFEVAGYILKPINPEHLNQVLASVIAKLDNDYTQKKLLQSASRQIEKHLDLLRDRFCLEWMSGELSLDEIREQLLFLDLPQSGLSAICVLLWPELASGEILYSQRDRQLLLFAIENITLECFAQEHGAEETCVHFRDYDGYLVFLLRHVPSSKLLAHIRESVQSYLNIRIHSGLALNGQDMDGIHLGYQQAKASIQQELKLSPLIKQAKEWIAANHKDQGLSLEQAARALNVTPVYLSRLFKQETGRSFIGHLTYTRMKTAIELLQGSDMTIQEISQQAGYETQHYFSTAFKKTTGMSPNQYRKR